MNKNGNASGQENTNLSQETQDTELANMESTVPSESNDSSISISNNNELTNTATDNSRPELSSGTNSEDSELEISSSFSVSASSNGRVHGDFNGDGRDDLAIGVPGEIDGSTAGEGGGAGGVEVIYGSSGGLSATLPVADQFWTQDSANIEDVAEIGDSFGRALAAGDFNGDGKDDLAIGADGENIGSIINAGAVQIIYGSSGGLSATAVLPDQFWTQDSLEINDHVDEFDAFGSSLSAGDFNGDGRDDLAIGVPLESVGSLPQAGGVQVIYGSSNGLSATAPRGDQFWLQGSSNVEDTAEDGDRFGWSLTSGDFNNDGKDDLAIGVAFEGLGAKNAVGAVEVIYGSSSGLSTVLPIPDQFWTQDSTDINDHTDAADAFGYSLASGDLNGDGNDDLAIGVPFESVGSFATAGGVEVIYGSASGLSAVSPRGDQFWTQDSTEINDHSDQNDNFGTSLVTGDFNADGRHDLAIGARLESVGSVPNAGGVEVIYGASGGLSATSPRSDQFWTQDSPSIEDVAEDGDGFGNSLTSGDFNNDGRDDLAIGVISEDVGSIANAGGAEIIYGSSAGLSSTFPLEDQFWTQDTTDVNDHADTNDGFGASLG
jgi:hypothetical protein